MIAGTVGISILLMGLMVLAGCGRHAAGPRVYRIGEGGIVTPPAQKLPVRVPGVRGPGWTATACEAAAGPFSLKWNKSAALLPLPKEIGASLPDQALEEFRSAIVELEARECLAPGGAHRVLDAFASALKLPARSIYFARYGVYYDTGALDFEPRFLLKVVSPLLRPGTTDLKLEATVPGQPGPIEVKVGENLEGYETSTYAIDPVPPSGVRPRLVRVEQIRKGEETVAEQPSGFQLQIPAEARHLRVLFLRRRSASDRDITLTGARTLSELDAAARRIQRAGDARAACLAERDAFCMVIPQFSALNLELRFQANGREVGVPAGGTVAQALSAAGLGGRFNVPIPETLRVLRPWRDRLLPVIADSPKSLQSLVLLGGEQIFW